MTNGIRKNQEDKEWIKIVTTKMTHLSKPQAVVLAMWSFGMVMTGSCGLSTVSVFWAALLGKKVGKSHLNGIDKLLVMCVPCQSFVI